MSQRRVEPAPPLAIQLPQVEERPRRFRLEAGVDWWERERAAFREPESRLLEPVVLDLEAYRLGRRLLFRGDVTATLELPCGRCLEPFRFEIRERLELLLEPLANAGARPEGPPEGGIELDPEDLEVGRYAGEELDLAVVLRELLHFSWPMQPRCAEGCLGLCPSCGANRNREACACDEGQSERPFAELRELIERSKLRSGS